MQRSVLKLALVALAAMGIAGLAAVSAGAVEGTGTTCARGTGVATISPGIEEVAKVQNITIKGVLGECTGSAGSSAKYVAHLKTTTALTCAASQRKQATAISDGKGTRTLTVTGSPGVGRPGRMPAAAPFRSPVFSGKGEPCTKKNKLKQVNVAGTSPFTIA